MTMGEGSVMEVHTWPEPIAWRLAALRRSFRGMAYATAKCAVFGGAIGVAVATVLHIAQLNHGGFLATASAAALLLALPVMVIQIITAVLVLFVTRVVRFDGKAFTIGRKHYGLANPEFVFEMIEKSKYHVVVVKDRTGAERERVFVPNHIALEILSPCIAFRVRGQDGSTS
jgi:ABC-type spermidine/putrescine transport system permease subunit II